MFQTFESFTKAWGSWQFAVLDEVPTLTRANLAYHRELGEEPRKRALDAVKLPKTDAA